MTGYEEKTTGHNKRPKKKKKQFVETEQVLEQTWQGC